MKNLRNSFNSKIRELLVLSTALLFSLFWTSFIFAFTPDNQVNTQAQNTSQQNQIQKTTLIVGSEQDFPPFATGMTDETAGGFTVELWKAVAAEAGLNYHIRVLPFNQLLDEFKAGKIDVLINLNVTDETHIYADFSVPHAVFTGGIFVRNSESNISSEADLKNKSIIMMKDDVESSYATSRGWDKQLVLVDTAADGLRLLDSGKHDAMLINKVVGLQTLKALKLTNIKALKAMASFTQKFAFAVHHGESELLAKINEAFAVTIANKTYDRVYEKWFGIYLEKEIGLRDLLEYIIPIVLLFTCVLVYFFYRRRAERKQITLEKQATEKKLSAFYELDLVGLTVTSPDKGWIRINDCLCKMLEYSELELLSMTWAELTHPDDLAADVEQFTKLLANEIQGYSLEKRFISKSGKVIPTKLVVRCTRKDNGEVDYVMAMVEDITEHKQTELLLRNSQQQLNFVLEASGLGFWDWHIPSGVVERNHIWAEMLGYTYEEIKRTTNQWADFVHPDDIQNAWKSINDALEGRTTVHELVYRMRTKSGEYKWILDRAKVVELDAEGKAVRMTGSHRDYTERKHLELELTRQAHLDYLTGLSNRRHFMEQGEVELARAIRYDKPLSILMLDIDFFKKVNDTYGHQVGDAVLQALSKACQNTLRQVDIAGRLGGEEFGVILPETTDKEALDVAERLREVIANTEVTIPAGLPIHFNVSIGVSKLNNKDANIDMLLNQADKALYEAKQTGRNKVCVG